MSITSWLSTPTRLQRLPISLANTTFTACQALLVYLIISATRMLVLKSGASMFSYSALVGAASAAWLCPTSVSGGSRKSLSAVPSRRNSGLTETPKPSPYCLARRRLERRNDAAVRRARKHGAADDDDVICGLVAEHLADLLADARQIRQVEAAVLAARRADADQREVRCRDRLGRICRRAQAVLARLPLRSRSASPGSTIGLRPSLMARPCRRRRRRRRPRGRRRQTTLRRRCRHIRDRTLKPSCGSQCIT